MEIFINFKYSLLLSDCKIKKEAKVAMNDEDALWLWIESAKWTGLDKDK